MASTAKRWMNPSGVTLGGVTANDVISIDLTAESQAVASNSEADKYANRFITGVQRATAIDLNCYDVAFLASLLDDVGSLVGAFSATLNPAADSSATTNYVVETTTCANTFLQAVRLPMAHDTESQPGLSLIFKSNGTTPPVRLRAT